MSERPRAELSLHCKHENESRLSSVGCPCVRTVSFFCALTGKPGDTLPVKRKPEKLIELKRKVGTEINFFYDLKLFVFCLY